MNSFVAWLWLWEVLFYHGTFENAGGLNTSEPRDTVNRADHLLGASNR